MKKILIIGILGIFMISFVSANIFTDAWDFITGSDKEESKVPSWEKLGLNTTTFDTFDTKKNQLDKSQICIKDLNDQTKIVKLEKCSTDKVKYTLIDISDTNYFKINNQNIVRFNNE